MILNINHLYTVGIGERGIHKYILEEMVMKKTKGKLVRIGAVLMIAAMLVTTTGCGKKSASSEDTTKVTLDDRTYSLAQEKSKKTDIVVFTVKDAAGNDVTLEGVAVTDEHGNAVITVTDVNGNEIKVNAKAEKDADGNTVIKDAVVVNGGEITKADGSKVEIADNTSIADVKNNNDGLVKTDVGLSEDKKQEVAAEQEHEKEVEQAKEEITKAEEASKTDVANKDEETAPTEKPTEPQTERQTEPETEAPTERPTQSATEAPTQAPTQEPTTAPTEPEKPTPPHGVAVGTKQLAIVYHGRNKDLDASNVTRGDFEGEPIHTSYIEYPIDAYGEPIEEIYDIVENCYYLPEDSGFDTYIVTAYVYSNGDIAYGNEDLREYMVNGQVHLYMCWMNCR